MLHVGWHHWVTRPDLETIFETKMVSNRSRDHFETKMSHYLEWRDWSRDHFRDQNGLDSGLETSIDTKMSHSACGAKKKLSIEQVWRAVPDTQCLCLCYKVEKEFPGEQVWRSVLPFPSGRSFQGAAEGFSFMDGMDGWKSFGWSTCKILLFVPFLNPFFPVADSDIFCRIFDKGILLRDGADISWCARKIFKFSLSWCWFSLDLITRSHWLSWINQVWWWSFLGCSILLLCLWCYYCSHRSCPVTSSLIANNQPYHHRQHHNHQQHHPSASSLFNEQCSSASSSPPKLSFI